MIESPVFRPHSEAPARAEFVCSTPEHVLHRNVWRELRCEPFHVVSRGDFVPGLLYLPPDRPPDLPPESPPQKSPTPSSGVPLVLIQHGMAGDKTAPYLDFAARWVREGWAVAMIDLPLHGERSSPKLSERLIESIDRSGRNETLNPESAALVEEFARQCTSDLMRTREALAADPRIDAKRIGYLGFSLGAIVGCYLLGHDAEIRGAVFALGGGGFGPREQDPANYLSGELCPDLGLEKNRPILVVCAEGDDRVPASATQKLFAAALEPKTLLITKGDHGNLPGKTLGEIRDFLRKALDA